MLPEIGPIPRLLRWVILALLVVAVLACAGLLALFTLIRPDRELAILSLTAAQSALTGLVVVSLVLFSFRSKGTRDIQRIIDGFFIDDMMTALQGVDTEPAPMIRYEGGRQFRRAVTPVKALSQVSSDFAFGRDAASFRVEKPGDAPLDLYLKINVRHVAVKYFLDPALFSAADDEAAFKEVFRQTLNGAESVGYTWKVLRRYHASRGAEVLELSLYYNLAPDFLANPAERLFLSNDLRTLTASIQHSLNGLRQTRAG